MSERRPGSLYALLRRELLEYRTSLCWTPLVMLLALASAMLVAVAAADQIDAVRKTVLELIPEPGETGSRVSIRIDDQGGEPRIDYRVEKPLQPLTDPAADISPPEPEVIRSDDLNGALQLVHKFFLFVMILVSANYLLGALYGDRRDRSVLFWKSMPVSDTREVLGRFAVAMIAVPGIYGAASLLAQGACLGLGMVLAWRMEMDALVLVWYRVDLASLLIDHLIGFLVMTLWLAPAYAWLLLASAAATRSPFMLALTPVLGLLLCERILLGSSELAAILSRFVPHLGGSPYAGFYWQGMSDLPLLLAGLVFMALALVGAVYLRRYYFEL